MVIHSTYYGGINLTCYLIAVVFGVWTTKILHRHALQLSARTFAMQKQFGRALFAQVF
jgi:hypothetical protein